MRNIISITGLPGSGKSTVCAHLITKGFKRVSAGSAVAEFVTIVRRLRALPDTRSELQRAGMYIVSHSLEEQFGQFLVSKIGSSKLVVFDGIRLLNTINHIQSLVDLFSIYLDIDEGEAAKRLSKRDSLSIETARMILDAEIERAVIKTKIFSDIVISTNCSASDVIARVDSAISA